METNSHTLDYKPNPTMETNSHTLDYKPNPAMETNSHTLDYKPNPTMETNNHMLVYKPNINKMTVDELFVNAMTVEPTITINQTLVGHQKISVLNSVDFEHSSINKTFVEHSSKAYQIVNFRDKNHISQKNDKTNDQLGENFAINDGFNDGVTAKKPLHNMKIRTKIPGLIASFHHR
eukprot:GHVL01035814.1.p1 GENE.GHVL01035814.1~~GHVL01035814.1.p1  ORF type:complete len:177 (+),score=28.04 GHVL01035814.1:3-533(+)